MPNIIFKINTTTVFKYHCVLESGVDYRFFFTMGGYSFICIYMCMNLNMWREKMQFEMTSCLCVVSPGILLLYRF